MVWVGMSLAGCDAASSGSAPPVPSSASSAAATASSTVSPLSGRAELAPIRVVAAKGDAGEVVTQSRALVPTVATGDDLRLLLDFRTAGGAPVTAHEAASLAEIQAVLVGPGGARQELIGTTAKAPTGVESWPLRAQVLHLDREGIRIASSRSPLTWKTEPKEWLGEPGEYRVALSGTLHVADGDAGVRQVAWKSGELTVDVRTAGKDFRPVAEVEAAAAERVRERRRLTAAPQPTKATLEDEEGNRLVRFALQQGHYDIHFVEMVMKPDGTPLHEREEKVFTCVAEGSPVLTPSGPRPIETLRTGDEGVAYDVEGGRRVVTRVVENLRSWADTTLQLTPELRVTPEHPIFVATGDGGRFVRADRLGRGSVLRTNGALGTADATPAPGGFVHDLGVEWPHTYYAGGILVHNKATATTRGRRVQMDTWSDVDLRPKEP